MSQKTHTLSNMLPVSVSHPAASGITALVKRLVPQTHKLQEWALETSERLAAKHGRM